MISRFRSTTPILLVAAALVAAVCVVPTWADHHDGENKVYVVGVEGMICPSGCTTSVREALETVDGVEKVEVNFDEKNATVDMAPGKTLTADSCEQAFDNSGYFISSFDEKQIADADEG